MPSIDMPLEQLRQYKPSLYREANFESFWDETLAAALAQPLNAELIPYPSLPTRGVQIYALRFDGFEGGRLAGWYVRPAGAGTFPGIAFYHGYSMRAARPLDMVPYAAEGFCCLSMDVRGQNGSSQDTSTVAEGHLAGWMTKGIRDPQTYYFRYVYADAVRALEVLAQRQEVDENRLAVVGGSQGGGLSLAVAALSDRPRLALPDHPFLCDFKRSVAITPKHPYLEIPLFLKSFPELNETAFRTLSYCDNLNLAPWITCKTVMSVSLLDDICSPSSIFGTYHHIAAEKQMIVYPFHGHEVPMEHRELQFRTLVEALNA